MQDPGEAPSPIVRWLAPLTPSLWLLLLLGLLLTLLLLWLASRLAPLERRSPPHLLTLFCTLLAPWLPSTWAPRAASCRLLTASWAPLHLLLLLLYLLHLPAHLIARPSPRLGSVQEVLVRGAEYGVVRGGSTEQLLRVGLLLLLLLLLLLHRTR